MTTTETYIIYYSDDYLETIIEDLRTAPKWFQVVKSGKPLEMFKRMFNPASPTRGTPNY